MNNKPPNKIAGCRVRFKSKDGRYTVTVLDLPDCIVNGDTLREAERNAREAIQLHVEGMIEKGTPLPPDLSPVHKKRVSVSIDPARV